VVASPALTSRRSGAKRVSIPFIAGQWSLPARAAAAACAAAFQSPSLRGSGRFRKTLGFVSSRCARFNPLHCGAVVASAGARSRGGGGLSVSIPFIAGQWSLPKEKKMEAVVVVAFQSPSLRGSGRFEERARQEAATRARFNPLHCGAVVASLSKVESDAEALSFNPLHCGAVVASRYWLYPGAVKSFTFQSPSLRGSGRFYLHSARIRNEALRFQSPSLRGSGRFLVGTRTGGSHPGFNPLHCGAVVASGLVRLSTMRISASFNPLHCGAVVASKSRLDDFVFLIGFNPLHCGAVVASRPGRAGARRRRRVSIPFIAGQWSLQRGFARARRSGRRVSIPFIAGQWSLHYFIHTPIVMPDGFQSPSLRGSGRFWDRDLVTAEILRFQSPSLRGSGRFARAAAGGGGARWSFNPLHCGAVVASKARCSWARARLVSIPFIAGQWSLLLSRRRC